MSIATRGKKTLHERRGFAENAKKGTTQHSRMSMIGFGLSLFRLLAGSSFQSRVHTDTEDLDAPDLELLFRNRENLESFQRIPGARNVRFPSNFVHTIGSWFPTYDAARSVGNVYRLL